jgi:peptidoglycan/LPS O-acetylase OafA/YrhL
MANPSQNRLAFVDNLRWVLIVLVVSMHAAVTYSHMGSWYFMEDPKPSNLGTLFFFGYYQMGLQAFFMGLLFLIAGYFVPDAYDRKGQWKFLTDRFVRLGIPALFYMLVVHPLIVFWLLRNYRNVTASFWTSYLNYLLSLQFVGSSGPMWFTVALFLFCLAYALSRRFDEALPGNASNAPLPTGGQVILLVLLMGLSTFLMRIVQPMGTNILNMQLCFFSQYILLFAVGILARRRNWLLRIPYKFGVRWLLLALTGGSLIWMATLSAIVMTHTENNITGGFTWQSAVVCFWESFFCLGLCLGLIVLFRDRFNKQGRFAAWMTTNCFAVYLFHAPVLIAVTLGMQDFSVPKPVKFFIATMLATTATYLASSLVFRRIPLLQRVL